MPMVSHQASLFLGRRVTVEPVQNYDIPTYYYNFATFDILDSRKTHPKQLTGKRKKLRKIRIRDVIGNPLEITLWGEKSNLIQPETALGKAIVVTATIVTQYEFKQLESTVSTTVELNPNFPELQSYIDRFNQLPAAEEEEPVLETLTIAELLDKGKNATQKRGKFICNAKITTAQEYRGWFYVKCSGYGKSAYEEDDNFVCAHCPVPKEPNIRYSLNTIIADNTSTIEAIFFDESLHSLLGVSCKTLVMNKNNKNPKIFPPEIHHIINVPLTLTVNIKPDGTLSVDKAKANNTATTSETARMSERETITPATSILKDYSSISEITPSTPNPKIIRDKRAPSSQTVVISCDQEHIWSHIIRAIQELHQKIMSYIEELKHLQIPLQDISKGPADMQSSFVISNACGTLGYIDPEYFYTGHLTPKSDVFSFGVVLFEVLCKRPAFVTVNGQFFYVWVQKHYKRRKLDEIIHSDLHEQINPASLLTFSTVAYQCLSIGEERPTMKEVAEQLQRALDNQLAPSRPRSNAYNDDDFAARYQRHSRGASSSQPSPAISQPRKYDVFLSFRGEDTRKSFVDHLYSSLVQQLEIFKDDEALTRGELIGASLFKSIKESKIAIVVFSKNYASSSWCLDELKYIMECRVETGLIVIPVFYDVDPSDVRRQSGPYAEAFSKHKSKNTEKFESWRKALVDAASISGFVITGSEAKAIQEIVYTVTHRLLSLMPSDELQGIPVDVILERFNCGDDGINRDIFSWLAA
ncbi:hypothetical protein QVD17_31756 [Tagetes erecta]|uniref:TIR domain-containing protein n=1 Tax=Tagetes erecta TaxID=13708 RepID=A0AAD8NPL9_TARER|nr:hypothetical protein QVD17_31756 [Tagetes erecta]